MRVRVEWTSAGIFRFQASVDSESEKEEKKSKSWPETRES